MASELFHDLYRRAFKSDCAVIHTLNQLMCGMGPGATTVRVPLAESLLDAARDFDDGIDLIARRANMDRRADVVFRCPNCGLSYCPGAVPMVKMPNIASLP
jgi:hypothetical protein